MSKKWQYESALLDEFDRNVEMHLVEGFGEIEAYAIELEWMAMKVNVVFNLY